MANNIARSERNIYLITKTCRLDTGGVYSIVFGQSAKTNTFLTISVINYNAKYLEKFKGRTYLFIFWHPTSLNFESEPEQ